MRSFSERYGHTPVRESLQIEEIEKKTRIRIWNLLSVHFFNEIRTRIFSIELDDVKIVHLWHHFFGETISGLLKMSGIKVFNKLEIFIYSAEWYRVYNFIEEIIIIHTDCEKFIEQCNILLEREMCGYRIVDSLVTRIINPMEINEIEEALRHPFETIHKHLKTALELFSDRVNPNYPNSVKEAISAVEGICRIIVADKNVTLGRALNELEDAGISIHGAFRSGLSSLYGWTSADGGIRHAIISDSEIGPDEAKFMIVLCSAFVNYLIIKAGKSGIDLESNYEAIK